LFKSKIYFEYNARPSMLDKTIVFPPLFMFLYIHRYLQLASVPVTRLATKRGEETARISFTVLQNIKCWRWHRGLSLATEPPSCCSRL